MDLAVGKPRLDPLLQQLQDILDGNQCKTYHLHELNDDGEIIVVLIQYGMEADTYQPAGEANHGDGGLGGLGDVQQVVEQSLVLMVGEEVELIQNEQHWPTAAAIPCERRKRRR